MLELMPPLKISLMKKKNAYINNNLLKIKTLHAAAPPPLHLYKLNFQKHKMFLIKCYWKNTYPLVVMIY